MQRGAGEGDGGLNVDVRKRPLGGSAGVFRGPYPADATRTTGKLRLAYRDGW